MKRQRFRFKLLTILMFALFLLLAVYGCYSVVIYGNRWFSSSHNPRVKTQKESVIAGDILDRNGLLLATTAEDGSRVYAPSEAVRRAVVHVLGDGQGNVSNGVETFQTNYLYGFQTSLMEQITTLLSGGQRRGDNVTLTIDSRLCASLDAYFDQHPASLGKRGAAVVMNYRTGEVLALISRPNFDPESPGAAALQDGQPYWNRALQSLYPPGSTFKIVTMLCAMQHIPASDEAVYPCGEQLLVDGQAIRDYGGAVHGSLTLRQAFMVSCNKVFACIALDAGDDRLRRTAEAFGFGDNFLFRDLVVENSRYPTGVRTALETAASGFGQSAIGATPMHMCMVAASVANGGVMMEPRLLYQVTGEGGIQRVGLSSKVYRSVMSAQESYRLEDAMRAVVTGGTGTRAQVGQLPICGKTGTAESTLNGRYISYGWFVGYIADKSLPYAVCVVVEDIDDGLGGGSVCAPIAADVFRYLDEHRERVASPMTGD